MSAATMTAPVLTTALRQMMAEVDAAMAATGQGACHATRQRITRELQAARQAATKPVELWAGERAA